MGKATSFLTIVVLLQAGCDRIEQWTARGRSGPQLTLSLEAPEALDWGSRGTVRLNLRNGGTEAVANSRLELYLPTWMEFAAVEPPDTEVTLRSGQEWTRLSYLFSEPLHPGDTRGIVQHIRVVDPGSGAAAPGALPPPADRVIRARLVDASGEAVAGEIQAVVAFRGAAGAGPGSPTAARPIPSAPLVQGSRVGPVRVGMTAEEARRAAPGARDTVLPGVSGTGEQAVLVPLGGGGSLMAVLTGTSVQRIVVSEASVRTEQGLGVGSRVRELRDSYGRGCVETLRDGRSAVHLEGAPYVSFIVGGSAGPPPSTPAPGAPPATGGAPAGPATADAATLPDSVRVAELWVHEQRTPC